MSDVADELRSVPVLTTTERFHGGVIDVRTDRIALPDGSVVDRDVVMNKGAVGVLAVDPEWRVLLVRQYRHPVGAELWEPPAGLLDKPGETAQAAAARELFEEAGYSAREWRVLVDGYASPGMSDEAYRIFLARDVSRSSETFTGEAEERDMPQAWVPLDAAVSGVLQGRLHNPMAVMGVLALAAARGAGLETLRAVDAPWPARPEHVP